MKESNIMALHTNPVQAFIGPRSGRLGVEAHSEGTKLDTSDGVEFCNHLMELMEEHEVDLTGFFAPIQKKNPTWEDLTGWLADQHEKTGEHKQLAAVVLDQKWGPSICILENDESYSRKVKVVL